MGKRIEYKKGDLVGKNNNIYLKELPQKNKKRRALFLCGLCKQNEFEANIESVRNNYILSCGCSRFGQIHNPYGMIGKDNFETARNEKYKEGAKIGNYNNVLIQYINSKKSKFKCGFCGDYYYSSPYDVKNDRVRSCGCISKSTGETLIKNILVENNINFVTEKTFKDLRNPNNTANYRFDFYIIDDNYLIEYDGQQHFMPTNWKWNTPEHFKKLQENDMRKNTYCKEHNIPLIRIPYTHLRKIKLNDLLLTTSNFIV